VLAKDKEIIDGWRQLPAPDLARNRANMVGGRGGGRLVTAVRESFPRLSHRYYAMKAKWLGLAEAQALGPQRAAARSGRPLHHLARGDGARAGQLRRLQPRSRRHRAALLRQALGGRRAPPRQGLGAFAHPTVPSAHPYLLVNFHGKTRDVMTLAHELGHGVHQILAGEQGYLMSSTPLTLAETASVFGEMLTFRALLDAETDPSAAARCWPPRWRTC
jgi:oligoendopeptidase F